MTQAPSVLVDVGGTNTRVAFAKDGQVDAQSVLRFKNADYSHLYAILDTIIDQKVSGICVDIAGPVSNGTGRLTNVDWLISEDQLCERYGATKSLLINDLQAQAYGLNQLDPTAIHHIHGPVSDDLETRLVINIGTGFNASPIYKVGARYFVPENEAGHAALALCEDVDLGFLIGKDGDGTFRSVEHCLSGDGLWQCVQHFAPTYAGPRQEIFPTFADTNDAGLRMALTAFAKVMGSVAGDLSLTHLPHGGVFFVGGVATGIAPFLNDLGFEAAFKNKGRFGAFMDGFGVYACADDLATLKGCAVALMQ